MDHELAFTRTPLRGRRGFHVTAGVRDTPASFAEAIAAFRGDGDDRLLLGFLDELERCPLDAYFFETPPLTAATIGRAFEFVLVDAPALTAVRANPRAFARHLRDSDPCASFQNLGGTAQLVAPCDRGADCAHLASFARSADLDQRRALWRATALALTDQLGDAPRWLSTSGLGVHWLHVRIDERPKYYTWPPYRAFPSPY